MLSALFASLATNDVVISILQFGNIWSWEG